MEVGRVKAHCLPKLLASGRRLAGLEQSIGQVLADISAARGQRHGLFKEWNRRIVIMHAQGLKGFVERCPRGVFRRLGESEGEQEKNGASHGLPFVQCADGGVCLRQVFAVVRYNWESA